MIEVKTQAFKFHSKSDQVKILATTFLKIIMEFIEFLVEGFMPTYDYRCIDCKKRFEVVLSFSENDVYKPTCRFVGLQT